ncbi:MAG: hypothetical protein ABIC91_03665 [Nanoarchaeota archaeon]|nr:hypothetical protein [Nanoarchaeota archaeon]MBU1031166.1 hypothetical protein [Nanoarchaeota archaeon]MBU1849113.1 hypothetical protein [Nanoarchaeota archaeon]
MGGMSSSWSSSGSYDWGGSSSVTRKSARDYSRDDNRSYTGSSSKGIAPPVGKDITAKGDLAAILVVDVTGSMQKWPKLIFEKIPTLYNEANVAIQGLDLKDLEKGKKASDNLELAVIAIGDAYVDERPLQVVDFSKGADLVKGVNKIFPEGGGGSFGRESYELAAYYLVNHCKTPNMTKSKPLLIFACDENFYDSVKSSQVKGLIGDNVSAISTNDIMKSLDEKFDTYILRPEPSGPCDVYRQAESHWKKYVDNQKVLKMSNPERLVDCIIGIAGYASNHMNVSNDLLKRRQTSAQVEDVLKTLHPLLSK